MTSFVASRPRRSTTQFLLSQGVIPLLLIVMIVVAAILDDRFLTVINVTNVLRQAVPLVVVALAQMLILLTGGFDLSLGTNISLVSVLTAETLVRTPLGDSTPGVILGILLGVAAGAAFGAVNGAGVAMLRVNPFITTLATAAVGTGVCLLITGGSPVINLPGGFGEVLGYGTLLGVPVPVYVCVVVVALVYFVLSWTRWGRFIYAVGSSSRAARISGVPITRTVFSVYMFSGALIGVAGVLLTARVSTGDSALGTEYTMQSITAAVLGGVSLGGGEGRVRDAVLGALFIAVLANVMDLVGISSFYQQIVLGVVLMAAVVFDRLRHRLALRSA